MTSPFDNLPQRVTPYVSMGEASTAIQVAPGPFRLTGPDEGDLESDLHFRWLPTTAIEFEGSCSLAHIDLDASWSLRSQDPSFELPVYITSATWLGPPTEVRGIIREPLVLGTVPFEVLRFTLVNFPEYHGDVVGYTLGDSTGSMTARLQVGDKSGTCRVDAIPESANLRKATKRDPGYVLTHVGEWLPNSGSMTANEAADTLDMLHIWFGLLAGTWSGPLFPQGLTNDEVVWRNYAAWKLGDGRSAASWMPEHAPLDLSAMFAGFTARWHDPAWRHPLRLSVAWFVEANAPATAMESRLILAQVALELLAQVHMVETRKLYSRAESDDLPAAKRIRLLLQDLDVPTAIPSHMIHLPQLAQSGASDGPGVLVRVRNALVHQHRSKRAYVSSLDGITLYECTQLALQYVELVLLALCGHDGLYARRAWRGAKGPDEVRVPWKSAVI